MLVLMAEVGVLDRYQGRCLSKPVVRNVDHFKSACDVAKVKTESFIFKVLHD